MKKIITLLLSLTLASLIVPAAHAGNTSYFNGTIFTAKVTAPATASAASVESKAAFYGLIFRTDGTNNITLNVYDNASEASGTKLVPTDVIILGSSRLWTLSIDPPIAAANGIYVSISIAGGGATSYQVLYDD